MRFRNYRYQIGIIALSATVSIASYIAVLNMLDSIIGNYDVYSFARQVSSDPQSVERRFDRLTGELANKRELLESARTRKPFTQDVFHELAETHKCRLMQLSNKTDVDKQIIIYDAAFSGTVRRMLDLLNNLETQYLVRVNQVSLRTDNEAGTRVRMTIVLAVDENELR